MVDPPPWPTRPLDAVDFDAFWLVRRLPPDPFPDDTYDYGSDARFGPPGTRWVFSIESLINRRTAPGVSQGTKAAIDRLLNKFGNLPPLGSTSWATPLQLAPPAEPVEVELGNMMQWLRTSITGVIGTDEEVVHVLNWRHSTIENAGATNAEVKAFGDKVRDAWVAFFNGEASGAGGAVSLRFSPRLRYTEVRTSLLRQDAPGGPVAFPQATQVSPFPAGLIGTGEASGQLPYEVALGVSLNTNWRGTSRFRGRTYLGPLTTAIMAGDGQFNAPAAEGIGNRFGLAVVAGVATATDYELHIISQKFGTSAAVTGVRMGKTPDSQRRRRRDRPEAYAQVWGTPVGGAA